MDSNAFIPNQITKDWLNSLPLPPKPISNSTSTNSITSTSPTNTNQTSTAAVPNYTKSQWKLIEDWRLIITSLNYLSHFENNKLFLNSVEYEQKTELLAPLIEKLDILPSNSLSTLSSIYSIIPTQPTPIQSTSSIAAIITEDPLPSIYAAVTELENRIVYLGLEVNEAHSRLRNLEEEHLKKEKESLRIAAANHQPEDKASISRAIKSSHLLDQKTQEYRMRLASLQKQVDEQSLAVSSMSSLLQKETQNLASTQSRLPPSSLASLAVESKEFNIVKERNNQLKSKLSKFNGLSSVLNEAHEKVEENTEKVIELRKTRDKLLTNIGSGVY